MVFFWGKATFGFYIVVRFTVHLMFRGEGHIWCRGVRVTFGVWGWGRGGTFGVFGDYVAVRVSFVV